MSGARAQAACDPHLTALSSTSKSAPLVTKAAGAPALGLAGDVLAEREPAEDDDPQRRQRLSQLADQRQAAAALEHEVEDERIGLRAARLGEDLARIGHLADAAHVRLGIDQLAHDIAEIPMVLRDEHSQRLFLFLQGTACREGGAGRDEQITCPVRQASISRNSSSVFSRISASLPRDSDVQPHQRLGVGAAQVEAPLRETPSRVRR